MYILLDAVYSPHIASAEDEQSEYEMEKQMREQQFDERISEIQEELINYPHTSAAEILHPSIQNLPHGEIKKSKYDLNYQEIAE